MMDNNNRPLCIDLDGTLINTDAFFESGLNAFAKEPIRAAFQLVKNINSPAPLKEYAYKTGGFDVESAPFNDEIITFIKEQKASGRKVLLATASNIAIAEAVNEYLENLFDDIIASDNNSNLRGKNKAEALVEKFGKQGFDYMGNDHTDISVWQQSHTAYLVHCDTKLGNNITNANEINTAFANISAASGLDALNNALRIRQWSKNLLLFVAPITAHQLNLETLFYALIAFIAFSLMSSAGYVVNDLFDVADDRKHPLKKTRPFASGALSPQQGIQLAAILTVLSIVLSLIFLPKTFSLVTLGYLCATIIYTVFFKPVILVDVYTLGSFFTLRVIAGGIATSIFISMWLLSFMWLFFTGLAYLKRFVELEAVQRGQLELPKRRQYRIEDVLSVEILGITTSALTIPVLALYAASPDAHILYSNASLLWSSVPLFWAWQSRMWLIAHRGEMNYDPIVFATKDGFSYLILVFVLLLMWLAR